MNKNIVLATAPRAAGDLERVGLPFLGIAYVAGALEQAGYPVNFVDVHVNGWSPEEGAQEILKYQPDIVGITCVTNNRFSAIAMIKELKRQQPDLFIMVGGPHFTLSFRDALEVVPEIDCVVRGEGEITAVELVRAWPDKQRFKDILGIAYRDKSGKIVENLPRPFSHNLDDWPAPAWHLLPMEKYDRQIDGTDIRAIGAISCRGCPNRCIYCCNAAFGQARLRLRDPIKFVDEIEFLKNKYGYQGFDFWDDTMTMVRRHAVEICQEIIRRQLNIKWYARARVNTVDRELLKLMRQAGCIRISYGVESGSPRILKILKKGITVEQARRAVHLSSELGFGVAVNFMVSLPYETWEDLRLTVEMIKEFRRLPGVEPAYGFTLFYPGAEMTAIGQQEGWLPKDFSWNSPYQSEKYKLIGVDPSVPYLEMPGMPLEDIKAYLVKELMPKNDLYKKAWHKLWTVRSFNELKTLLKAGAKFLQK